MPVNCAPTSGHASLQFNVKTSRRLKMDVSGSTQHLYIKPSLSPLLPNSDLPLRLYQKFEADLLLMDIFKVLLQFFCSLFAGISVFIWPKHGRMELIVGTGLFCKR